MLTTQAYGSRDLHTLGCHRPIIGVWSKNRCCSLPRAQGLYYTAHKRKFVARGLVGSKWGGSISQSRLLLAGIQVGKISAQKSISRNMSLHFQKSPSCPFYSSTCRHLDKHLQPLWDGLRELNRYPPLSLLLYTYHESCFLTMLVGNM